MEWYHMESVSQLTIRFPVGVDEAMMRLFLVAQDRKMRERIWSAHQETLHPIYIF